MVFYQRHESEPLDTAIMDAMILPKTSYHEKENFIYSDDRFHPADY